MATENNSYKADNTARSAKKRLKRHTGLASIATVLLLVITIAIIALGQRWQVEYDLSASKRHSLTEQSIDTVRSLEQPVEIIAVMGPAPAQRQAVAALVSRYQQHNDQLSLEYVNLETEPTRVRELNAAPGGELIVQTQGQSGLQEARLQNLTERNLTAALTQLSRGGKRQVAFISGHDERTTERVTNSDFSELGKRLQQIGFETIEHSLVTHPVIPDSVNLVVIAAPQRRYFPGEVASLLQYVSGGGNLLWLIDESTEVGLQALHTELGIDTLSGVLLDATSAAYGADSPTFAVIDHQSLPQHAVNDGIANPILFPAATALGITPLAGQTLQPLLLSSDSSWTESGPIVGEVRFDDNGVERRGPLPVGVAVIRNAANPSQEQRIAVIGDADWLASQWIGNGANLEYAERLFNWLATDDRQLAFTAHKPADALINPTSNSILLMGGGFLLGMPLLFLVIAGSMWRRQRHG